MSALHKVMRTGLLLAGAFALIAAPVAAQNAGRIVLTPFIGGYVPSGNVGTFETTEEGTTITSRAKHQSTFTIGGTGSYWLNDRWAIEAGVAYTPSDVKVSASAPLGGGAFGLSDSEHARIWMGSLRAMVNVMPATSSFRLRLGAGPAVINHGGKAYKTTTDQKMTGLTNYGGAFSLCTRIPLYRSLGIRLRAEDYVYQTNFKVNDRLDPTASFNLGRKTQNDVVLSAGLQIGFTP
ncbi:MAG: hypothetical protein U0163_09510 [Gemmatimonadaceae bacterium]